MKNILEYEVKKFVNRIEYYYDGKLHRDDGPAIEHTDGSNFWYQNGILHRLDGPAIEYSSDEWEEYGQQYWYIDGIEYKKEKYNKIIRNYEIKKLDNRTEYYYKGKLHRNNDLPAIEFVDGSKSWYKNDQFHRLDGPAYEGIYGNKTWSIEGQECSEEEFNKISFGKDEIIKLKQEIAKKDKLIKKYKSIINNLLK